MATPVFASLTVSSAKNSNPVRQVTVSLWRDGQLVVPSHTVSKRAKTQDDLTKEVFFWAQKFGFLAGKAVEAEAKKTGTTGK